MGTNGLYRGTGHVNLIQSMAWTNTVRQESAGWGPAFIDSIRSSRNTLRIRRRTDIFEAVLEGHLLYSALFVYYILLTVL